MRFRTLLALAVCALLACLAPARALVAQATPTVILDDPSYRDARLLVDAGLARGFTMGQAPWSRRTFARIALAAERSLAGDGPGDASADRTLRDACERLIGRFAEEVAAERDAPSERPAVHPFSESRLHVLASDSPTRAIEGNGLGSIEADVNPLLDGRAGRRTTPGANLAFESEHWARIGSRLTLVARPLLWAADTRASGAGAGGQLLAANARLVARNLAVTLGRDETNWGNATGGGLFFSDNAPGLDMLRLASERPFTLPSVLGALGPASVTGLVADVGPSVSHSHSLLVAYKASIQPAPTVELGATFANHFGGQGALNPRLGRRLVDLLPFVDIFRHHADSTEFDSDKLLGADARVRIPAAGNITVFSELALEDFDVHRLRSVFTEDAAWIAGVEVPALVAPSVSAQLSYHATGLRFYQHHLLLNGYTSRRAILGDDLGRDASGWYGSIRWAGPTALELRADAAYESRGNDRYVGGYTQPGQQGLVFSVVSTAPAERRARLTGSAAVRALTGQAEASVAAGAERVMFAGTSGTHGVLEARFSVFR